jgi:hypothetical protein
MFDTATTDWKESSTAKRLTLWVDAAQGDAVQASVATLLSADLLLVP